MSNDNQQATRPKKHVTFLKMATNLSEQSTCIRRQVGCILVDRHDHIIGSGYNGNATGMTHCINYPCAGSELPSREGLHICEAVHAEQNALMQCANVNEIEICYTSASPCMHCMKMLMNTSCKLLVFLKVYDEDALNLWMTNSRETGRNYIIFFPGILKFGTS